MYRFFILRLSNNVGTPIYTCSCSSLKDTIEALLMHARPTYCYANKVLGMD